MSRRMHYRCSAATRLFERGTVYFIDPRSRQIVATENSVDSLAVIAVSLCYRNSCVVTCRPIKRSERRRLPPIRCVVEPVAAPPANSQAARVHLQPKQRTQHRAETRFLLRMAYAHVFLASLTQSDRPTNGPSLTQSSSSSLSGGAASYETVCLRARSLRSRRRRQRQRQRDGNLANEQNPLTKERTNEPTNTKRGIAFYFMASGNETVTLSD